MLKTPTSYFTKQLEVLFLIKFEKKWLGFLRTVLFCEAGRVAGGLLDSGVTVLRTTKWL